MPQPVHHQKTSEDTDIALKCQHMSANGMCSTPVVEGSIHCLRHGGHHQLKKNEELGLRNYRLTLFQGRIAELADNSHIKSLREEIGITRIQLEAIWNRCKGENDLLMESERINKLVSQIESLVISCQRLDEKTGSMLDKTQVFVICEAIVGIIADYVTDPDAMLMISRRITDVIVKTAGSKLDIE